MNNCFRFPRKHHFFNQSPLRASLKFILGKQGHLCSHMSGYFSLLLYILSVHMRLNYFFSLSFLYGQFWDVSSVLVQITLFAEDTFLHLYQTLTMLNSSNLQSINIFLLNELCKTSIFIVLIFSFNFHTPIRACKFFSLLCVHSI